MALVVAFAVLFYRFGKLPSVFKNDDFVKNVNVSSRDVGLTRDNGSKNTVAVDTTYTLQDTTAQYISTELLNLEANETREVEKVQEV